MQEERKYNPVQEERKVTSKPGAFEPGITTRYNYLKHCFWLQNKTYFLLSRNKTCFEQKKSFLINCLFVFVLLLLF